MSTPLYVHILEDPSSSSVRDQFQGSKFMARGMVDALRVAVLIAVHILENPSSSSVRDRFQGSKFVAQGMVDALRVAVLIAFLFHKNK